MTSLSNESIIINKLLSFVWLTKENKNENIIKLTSYVCLYRKTKRKFTIFYNSYYNPEEIHEQSDNCSVFFSIL